MTDPHSWRSAVEDYRARIRQRGEAGKPRAEYLRELKKLRGFPVEDYDGTIIEDITVCQDSEEIQLEVERA